MQIRKIFTLCFYIDADKTPQTVNVCADDIGQAKEAAYRYFWELYGLGHRILYDRWIVGLNDDIIVA